MKAPGSKAGRLEGRKWALGGLIVAGSAALVLSVGAWAGSDVVVPSLEALHAGVLHHGPHGGMFFGGRHLDRLLDSVDATPAQREQIKPLADKVMADLKALHEEGRALHEQSLKLWTQPTIDARAAEQLRQQTMAHHDKVSKRMLQAMIDVGNVLTPEQRIKLAERMQKRHDGMKDRPHHHGPRHGASAPDRPSGVKE